MEFKTLTTFLTVAEVGTIMHAAKRLHCVQSNVTNRIKTLEEELGVTLFQRSRSGMTLTAAGEVFLEHARVVIDQASMAKASVANFSTRVHTLRIGSMESSLAVHLPNYIALFRQHHPSVKIALTSAPTEELIKALLDNRLDIGFVGGHCPHRDIDNTIAFTEELVLVTSSHQQEDKPHDTAALIVFRHGCSYRAFTEQWMKRTGRVPSDIFELGTLDGILGCVAAGIGVTILPRSVVERSFHRENLTIHTLTSDDRFINTVAIHHKKAPANGALNAFLEQITNHRT